MEKLWADFRLFMVKIFYETNKNPNQKSDKIFHSFNYEAIIKRIYFLNLFIIYLKINK